jgi:peroxiredoxin
MTLNTELAAFKACMVDRLGPAQAEIVRAAEQEILAGNCGAGAPQVGDTAPDFSLPDQTGRVVNLYETLEKGPVILNFSRGAWCPFCMLTLRALQRQRPAARRIPATILAISPQDLPTTQATADTHGISFPLLTDYRAGVGKAWSLMYELPETMRPLYQKLGHVLPKLNGCGTWAVPITAGYVIAPDRRIVHAHLDPRVQTRMDPAEAIAIARSCAAVPAPAQECRAGAVG